MRAGRGWFLGGLFLTTFATLQVEILDTRLLSVITWYHLSFLAVSLAMFGMAAGAVRVYLGEDEFGGERAPRALARYALRFALSIPLSHVANLCIPIQVGASPTVVAGLVLSTLVLAVPFYLSGIVVSTALTRIPGPSGLIYALDLLGAALGSLLVVPLLNGSSITSAALVAGAAAALGAGGFARFAGRERPLRPALVALALLAAAVTNDVSGHGFHVVYSNGRFVDPSDTAVERWTIHGQVTAKRPMFSRPFYWGAGKGAPQQRVTTMSMLIDGEAGTFMTRWNGERDDLAWIGSDVTSLPYHLRRGGDAAVIGVGGGRDVLTALWGESRSVRAIEINGAFVDLLEGRFRRFANLATQPEVTLVHDEARSYLARTSDRFDVIQMSLVDTWAATGAGAFTLSENGLYTLEGWRAIMAALKPGGLFSVSRWHWPRKSSETSRLLALATAALLDRGVTQPREHIAILLREKVATLLVSPDPLTPADRQAIARTQAALGLEPLVLPGVKSRNPLFERILASTSPAELAAAVENPIYDFAPPTDDRPYFFSLMRPTALLDPALRDKSLGVVAHGNFLATLTLLILWALTGVLVLATILGPLVRSGRPGLDRRAFAQAVAYFALIGAGFMFVQIPLMQRFSVYLGHPTYTLAVILFSMILATGIGSVLSDRIDLDARPPALWAIPVAIFALIAAAIAGLQPLIDGTIQQPLPVRCALVASFVGVVALPLGTCFPLGLRLVRRLSDDATPWMWGINGAAGVLASVTAVAISMWSGISTTLYLAAAAYLLLALPALSLYLRGSESA